MKCKKRRAFENYEEYWKFTAAFTDISGIKFRNCLALTVKFIDDNQIELNSNAVKDNFSESNLYDMIQAKLVSLMNYVGKEPRLNARKIINQLVKIGFIEPMLVGYNPLTKKFLHVSSNQERNEIFSKIFYHSSSLASSVTKDNRNLNHIAFLLKTMDKMPKEHRALTMKDITALMVTDITQYKRGYLTVDELNSQYFFAKEYRFEDRKYNQIAHLASHLEHFVDLKFDSQKGEFWFENDLQIKDLDPDKTFKRDMICHRFFKEELKIESGRIYGRPVCYVEEVQHKTLVASHIKPCIDCLRQQKEDEAYDVNNGLLLSPTMDSYFDKKDITFSDEGEIIIGGGVPDDFAIKLKGFKLNSALMTPERKCYLGYHRTLFEAKNHA